MPDFHDAEEYMLIQMSLAPGDETQTEKEEWKPIDHD